MPARPPRDPEAEPDRWLQQAGFSIFFDVQPGSPPRRTRLYHEETGDEATFPGWEPAGWASWILGRLGLAPPASSAAGTTVPVLTIKIADARLTGVARPGTDDHRLEIQLHLWLPGRG